MKNAIILICFVFISGALHAQQIGVTIEEQPANLVEINDSTWSFTMNGEQYVILKHSVIKKLGEKVKIYEADTSRLRTIVGAKEELIKTFDDYQEKADKHIKVQNKMLTVADSLYQGYKSIYKDLKKYANINTLSFVPGIGFINHKTSNPQIIGSVGLAYNNFQGSYQFGKDYNGFVLGYWIRFPSLIGGK